jgi:hypothetical protein
MRSIGFWNFAAALLLSSAAQADVSISSKPTQNMSCNAGVCTATAQKAVLNVGDLQTMLANGDTTVKTGSVANDIEIDELLAWTSTSRLTLDARQSVVVRRAVTVAGAGALTIATNDGGKSGRLSFLAHGKIDFLDLASDLVIDGENYRLVDTVSTLAEQVLRHPGANVALASDYDAQADGVYSSSPVGTPFDGKLGGLGHVISHLLVSDPSGTNVGLFATLENKGAIANLGVKVGAVVGTNYVGGIAGYSAGLIEDSFFAGEVRGTFAGGVVGRNDGAVLRARSQARVRGQYAGGVVGQNHGVVDSSFATASIRTLPLQSGNIGGLVGLNSGDFVTEPGTITNSDALGDLKSRPNSAVGGLVGYNPQDSTIGTSYSTGMPQGKAPSLVGGFAGASTGTVQNSYWDITTSGTSQAVGSGSDTGITGLSDDQLRSGLPDGFDPTIWGQSPGTNNGYPYLLANPPPK